MDGTDVVSSPADLSASLDSAAAVDSTPAADLAAEPNSPDNENVDFDTLNAQEPGEESEAVEELTPDNIDNSQEEEEPEPDLAAKDANTEDEELPEGVRRGQDRSGKRGLFVTPERWKTIYDGGYKQLKTLEGIAGQPVTPELFDVYSRAHIGQEKLYGDLLSGDPKAVGNVLTHFLQEGARAMQEGEVGTDPIVPLAQGFYTKLAESHPEGYAALRKQAAQDLVNEMYAEAAAANNRNLWLSTGHIAKTLGMAFKPAAEMESFARVQTDPVRTLQQENQQLRTQLNGRSATSQAAQFDSWRQSVQQATQSAVLNDAVIPALADIQAAWSKLPDGESAFNDLVRDRLHSNVRKTMNDDKRFQDRMSVLRANAARATSAQKRNEIGEQIKQAHISRANLAIEALKPAVVAFANKTFKEQNDAKHARRAQAATHKAPSGPGAPVKRSLIPAGMDFENATPGNLAASLKGLFQ
jgi:hypothetical protein